MVMLMEMNWVLMMVLSLARSSDCWMVMQKDMSLACLTVELMVTQTEMMTEMN